MADQPQVKIAQNLPPSRPLTEADLERIAEEGRRWREAFAPIREAMERVTPEDGRIRVR